MKCYISRIQSSLAAASFAKSVQQANAGTEYNMLALCVEKYCDHAADNIECHNADKQTLESADIARCEVVLDRVWEVLNVGDWKDVAVVWRELYALCSAFIALLLHLKNTREKPNQTAHSKSEYKCCEALKACDMGLIMGSQHPVLLDLAQYIQDQHDNITKEQDIIGFIKEQDCNSALSQNGEGVEVHRKRPCTLAPTLHHPTSSLQVPTKPIPCHIKPSLESFLTLLTSNSPFIMDDVITHWPALEKWCPEYLLRRFGDRTVPIELGN